MFTVVQLFQRASRFVEYRLQNRQTFHLVLKHCQPHRNLIPSLHCTPYTGQQISSNLYEIDAGQQISYNVYKIDTGQQIYNNLYKIDTGQQISSNLYKIDTGQQISNNLYKIDTGQQISSNLYKTHRSTNFQ
jgi:type III secretion system FlhB-like substrate exporter